tara:strand:- start:87095 stop:87595 length:501 start_codon:yes stop_codon:yes gene_type:complete
MNELQRITTEYVEAEDRIRITGELGANQTTVLWLSQRLLIRLLPHLFAWLEKQTKDGIPLDIVQSFAQEAAKAELTPEAPVENIHNESGWLVDAVDLKPDPEVLRMLFRSTSNDEAILATNSNALRQWLVIIRALWSSAEWPKAIWPSWIEQKDDSLSKETKLSLH